MSACRRCPPASDPRGFAWTLTTRRGVPAGSAAEGASAVLALLNDGPTSELHAIATAVQLAHHFDAPTIAAVRARISLSFPSPDPLQALCLDRLAAAEELAALRPELGDPPFYLLLWLIDPTRPHRSHPVFRGSVQVCKLSGEELDACLDAHGRRLTATLRAVAADLPAVRRHLASRP
jgi:hypothetical protein